MRKTIATVILTGALVVSGGPVIASTVSLPVMPECEVIGSGMCELPELDLPDCSTPGLAYPQACEVAADLPDEAKATARYLVTFIHGLYVDMLATIDYQAATIARKQTRIERLRAKVRHLRAELRDARG